MLKTFWVQGALGISKNKIALEFSWPGGSGGRSVVPYTKTLQVCFLVIPRLWAHMGGNRLILLSLSLSLPSSPSRKIKTKQGNIFRWELKNNCPWVELFIVSGWRLDPWYQWREPAATRGFLRDGRDGETRFGQRKWPWWRPSSGKCWECFVLRGFSW